MSIGVRQFAKRVITGNRRVRGCSYDYLFRNATGSITLEVPAFGGRFEIDLRSHILRRILVNGEYEPEAALFVSRHVDPRRDAIDVGANIGLFTIKMLAAGARRVLAVEPMPRALKYLRQNILNNGRDSQVILHAGAASGGRGEAIMHHVPGKEEYSSIDPLCHPAISGMQAQCLPVQTETLDSLIAASGLDPAIVKIDTEGSEHRVLSGARNLLINHRPILVMEKWGPFQAEVNRILTECEYATRTVGVYAMIAAHRTMPL